MVVTITMLKQMTLPNKQCIRHPVVKHPIAGQRACRLMSQQKAVVPNAVQTLMCMFLRLQETTTTTTELMKIVACPVKKLQSTPLALTPTRVQILQVKVMTLMMIPN